MRVGDQLTLQIEKPAAGGRMIARHDGAVVLVAGAIPGEIVKTRVERVQRHTAWAATIQVVDASPDRLDADFDWSCGGCVFAHVRYGRQLDLKREIIHDALKRIGHLEPPAPVVVHPSPTDGYRMRARLHVHDGRLGFYREGSHALCDPARTGQLLTDTMDALRNLESSLRAAGQLAVTEVEVTENIAASQRAVHLILAPEADASRVGSMLSVPGVDGVSCSQADTHHTLVLSGSPFVRDQVSVPAARGMIDVTLTRHARSFFQANRFLLPELVAAVVDVVPVGHVVDLYAGVGLFAVAVAAAGDRQIVAIEGDRLASDDLKTNAGSAGGSIVARHQSVETFLSVERPLSPHTTIVDPPRTGLSKDALRGLLMWKAQQIVYVSCDAATFARDARGLVDAGYKLRSVRAFDLFPNTAHVETVAVLER